MKKRVMALLCAAGLIIGGCDGVLAKAAKKPVFLSKAKIALTVGKSKKVTVKNISGVIIKKKNFRSSNEKVATVTKTGKITAKMAGKATIKVTVKYTNGGKAKKNTLKCSVSVTKQKSDYNTPAPELSETPKPSTKPDKTPKPSMTPDATPTMAPSDTMNYTYSVTPLTSDVCSYFYVKTENPDPTSFDFLDEDTVLSDTNQCRITHSETEFKDVDYVDKETLRVKDGYIFVSSKTDGGKLTLETIEDGKRQITEQSVTIPKLTSATEYIINTYTSESMSFFEKMDAAQNGLYDLALYSEAFVQGKFERSEKSPYYGLSTSPHVDQAFYIQDPYYREGNQWLLASSLYPFFYDSLGFPSQMASIAKLLEPSAVCKKDDNFHWQIQVTYNGVTKAYGGEGMGGGQGITEDLIKYRYSFDGSDGDASTKTSWGELSKMINDYGSMTVPEQEKDLPELTWKEISDKVGSDGSYISLLIVNSLSGIPSGTGITFLYKNGDKDRPGYFSNVWYDGRFFNSHEFFEKGTDFDTTYASGSIPDIVIKDACIPFPESSDSNIRYLYRNSQRYYDSIENIPEYNADTKVWSGFTKYKYDWKSGTWIASVYKNAICRNKTIGEQGPIEDGVFVDACTLTLEEVKAMSIDRNADIFPTSFYQYDMTVPPGTLGELQK